MTVLAPAEAVLRSSALHKRIGRRLCQRHSSCLILVSRRAAAARLLNGARLRQKARHVVKLYGTRLD